MVINYNLTGIIMCATYYIGNMLTNKIDIVTRWAEYCSLLHNADVNIDENTLQQIGSDNANDEDHTPAMQRSEVEEAIKHIKDNKSPGVDNVPGRES